MQSRTVQIVEPKLSWSSEFAVIASELQKALGRLALQIDHIGSTAVPNLAAKDVIDVQVTVLTLEASVSELLLAAGYTVHTSVNRHDHLPPGFRPNERDWAKFFFMQRVGERRCNIHVRQAGNPNQRYPLLVRDFLRAEPESAQAYSEVKRLLAVNLFDPGTYPDVKDPISDLIYLAAERWAESVNWQLPCPGVRIAA